ncbi:hypothetical protein BDP27DRAFT_1407063 [Rhodocollybia butyracea]|uniref:Uncharacterized protein n=1 Tax=Rhodocollybia butyracea TaxID=206335 RepID=A0A9P5PC18_9AGAR|nr:hypothetical protein BDP27DRAFT_1407063 [Rhodocollybia butyracea]
MERHPRFKDGNRQLVTGTELGRTRPGQLDQADIAHPWKLLKQLQRLAYVKKLELTFLDHRTGRTRWGGRKKRPGSYTLLINKVLNMKGAKWVSAGITRGLPNKDGMAECIGIYPAWARDDNGARQQWETYRDKFNSLSIPGVPKTGSLSEPFQAAPTVTFIRIEDGQPLSLKPTDSSADLSAEGKDMAQEFRRSITNQIKPHTWHKRHGDSNL